MKKILFRSAFAPLALAPLALAVQVLEAYATTVTIGRLDPSKLITFAGLPPSDINSSSTGPVVYLGDVTIDGYTFAPVGKYGVIVAEGKVNLNGVGPNGNRAFTAHPYGDPGSYLAVQGGSNYSEKVSFDPMLSFTILWGSVDPTNEITFYDGSAVIASFTGAQLAADFPDKILANGDQHSSLSNVLLTFSDFPSQVTSAVLSSQTASFEFGMVAAPELSSWAMMALGFAGLGAASFKRSRKHRLAYGV